MMSLFIYILLLTMLYKFMTHQSVIFITLKSLTTRTILFLLKAGVLTDGLVQMTLTPVGEIVRPTHVTEYVFWTHGPTLSTCSEK